MDVLMLLIALGGLIVYMLMHKQQVERGEAGLPCGDALFDLLDNATGTKWKPSRIQLPVAAGHPPVLDQLPVMDQPPVASLAPVQDQTAPVPAPGSKKKKKSKSKRGKKSKKDKGAEGEGAEGAEVGTNKSKRSKKKKSKKGKSKRSKKSKSKKGKKSKKKGDEKGGENVGAAEQVPGP